MRMERTENLHLVIRFCYPQSAILSSAPAGIRTPNQQIMRRFEGHQQGDTKRDEAVFTESAAVKVSYILLRQSTPSRHNRAILGSAVWSRPVLDCGVRTATKLRRGAPPSTPGAPRKYVTREGTEASLASIEDHVAKLFAGNTAYSELAPLDSRCNGGQDIRAGTHV